MPPGRVEMTTDRMSYFDRIADFALHEHDRITPEQLRRQVLLALKEVERDTRHKAAGLAMALHGEIINIRWEQSEFENPTVIFP